MGSFTNRKKELDSVGAQMSSVWTVQENKEDLNLKLRSFVVMYASF